MANQWAKIAAASRKPQRAKKASKEVEMSGGEEVAS